jgi:hypothetical protein
MKNSVKTNSVKKTIETKKVVNRKPLTKAQKEERRKKRLANPQSSHLASNVYKLEQIEFRFNGKANLIEAKRRQNKVSLVNSGYENLSDLKLANKVINKIAKDKILLEMSLDAVRVNKDKSYSVFYFNQLAQKIVKLLGKGFEINKALVYIANQKKANK